MTLLAASSSLAAPGSRSALDHFRAGRAAYGDGDWQKALDEFTTGYRDSGRPGFLVNIGQCQRKLGLLDEAAASFEEYVSTPGVPQGLAREARQALGELRAQIASRAAARDASSLAAGSVVNWPAARLPIGAPAIEPVPAAAPAASTVSTAQKARELLGDTRLSAAPSPRRRTRPWVWGVVASVGAVVAAGVVVTVLETRPPSASIGVFDGRR